MFDAFFFFSNVFFVTYSNELNVICKTLKKNNNNKKKKKNKVRKYVDVVVVIIIYIYIIYKTKAFGAPTIVHVSTILKKKKKKT